MAHRTLNAILTEINSDISNNIVWSNSNFFTEATLQNRNEITWPLIRTGTREGKQISPLDTRGMQFYHRQVEEQENAPQEQYKGNNSYVQVLFHMRLIGVGYRAMFSSVTYNDTSDLMNAVMEIMGVNSSLSSKEQLIIEGAGNVNTLEVLNEEYEGNEDINKKWVLELEAFSINYTVKQTRLGPQC